MCGIVGLLSKKKGIHACLHSMVSALHHRGPDGQGIWQEEEIALGHTRLAIHDLTPSGHQPFISHSGRYVIVFNGEIYNYLDLKHRLEKEYHLIFQSTSDTEVLVNAIECWGLEKTLTESIGMFAFGVWDKKEKVLFLARDRFGEKPLYFGHQNGVFAFASELKAFRALKEHWDFHVDRKALSAFLTVGYISAPYSIFRKIQKLEPGYYAVVRDQEIHRICYWSAEQQAILGVQNRIQGPYEAAVDQLESLLKGAITLQKTADVPVGAFLSGGIDSSLVVALMQNISSQSVQTFSIGFEEKGYNEAPFAKRVAEHLGTEHTEYYLTSQEAFTVIQNLPHVYDEPFGDISQIPTAMVSKIARSRVTVSVSGDGADELFGGYQSYFFVPKFEKIHRFFSSKPGRFLLKKLVSMIPGSFKIRGFPLRHKLHRLALLMDSQPEDFYQYYMAGVSRLITGYSPCPQTRVERNHSLFSYQEWMMLMDVVGYLAGDILTKVDRAAMSVSLETRSPFLDHRIFEFAWRLPQDYKIKNTVGKRILKDVLYRYVPRDFLERPKQGFSFPYREFLRGPLKAWGDEYLSTDRLKKEGFLNADRVRLYWEEHCSEQRNWEGILWNFLMFQTWLESWNSIKIS